MCSCARGYVLKEKNVCSADNFSALALYFAHEKAIFSVNSTGGNLKVIVNTTGASGLDFHYGRHTLYWSDVKTKKVCTPYTYANIQIYIYTGCFFN